MVALPLVAIEGVHWAKDGPKFACNVNGCDASYTIKYNLVRHLWARHNVTMELGKPKHPSSRKHGPRVQDHTSMNVWILNNLLIWFRHNEKNVIARARRHALLEWDILQVDLQYTPEVFKLAFVRITFNHFLWLLNMTTWGVGAILFNVQAKLDMQWGPCNCDSNDSNWVWKNNQRHLDGAWLEVYIK